MVLTSFLALSISMAASPVITQDVLPRRGTLGVAFGAVDPAKRAELKLSGNEGLIAMSTVPNLTGDKAGIKAGDIVVAIDSKPAIPGGSISEYLRTIPTGQKVTFKVVRDGKTVELSSTFTEKPRDPGTANYTVDYSHIVSHGQKMRTIITTPKKPGKHPALFFIQGFSPISYDFTLSTSTGDVGSLDGPILHEFAEKNFVVVRIEKPGVGDSEGGPFAELDYTTELDIYRQTLKMIKSHGAVDPDNVFIFGHSMGGSFGPMVAVENPVKGIVVYGVAARTWHEYLLDTLRWQGIAGGGSYVDADNEVRIGARVISQIFFENKTAEEVKKSHPELAQYIDSLMPGGKFNGKTLEFWRQLGQINFATYWSKIDARVLAVRGGSDFVTYDVDHKLIADIVNKAKPGRGESMTLPNSDHLFHNYPNELEAVRGYSRGKFNPAFTTVMMDWVRKVMAEKNN